MKAPDDQFETRSECHVFWLQRWMCRALRMLLSGAPPHGQARKLPHTCPTLVVILTHFDALLPALSHVFTILHSPSNTFMRFNGCAHTCTRVHIPSHLHVLTLNVKSLTCECSSNPGKETKQLHRNDHANTSTNPYSTTELALSHTYCGVFPRTRRSFMLQHPRLQSNQPISSHLIFSSISNCLHDIQSAPGVLCQRA